MNGEQQIDSYVAIATVNKYFSKNATSQKTLQMQKIGPSITEQQNSATTKVTALLGTYKFRPVLSGYYTFSLPRPVTCT